MGQNRLMFSSGGQAENWESPYTYLWGDYIPSSHAVNGGDHQPFNGHHLRTPLLNNNFGGPPNTNHNVFSRDFTENVGVAMTTMQPKNASEWQLYRVLQRANLLQYYDTFIAQGGDDVQQLCEAGEDEFLEIMALVGMASKPLHVRRLQKALQEWVSNPAAFQGAISATNMSTLLSTVAAASSQAVAIGGMTLTPTVDQSLVYPSQHSTPVSTSVWAPQSSHTSPTTQPQAVATTTQQMTPQIQQQQTPPSGIVTATTTASQQSVVPPSSVSPVPHINTPGSSSGSSIQGELKIDFSGTSLDKPHSSTSPVPTPVLVESQINSIAEAAASLSAELPPFEAKRLNMKKQINREIMSVMQMPEDDPNRMEELRKYAAIYGRFDSKRKGEKPMSLHEISVNEAAAQLCRHRVALLTRREDLFPLARQIVKNSGYQYSKGHSRASEMIVPPMSASKRLRFDPYYLKMCESSPKLAKQEMDRLQREERMTTVNQELILITQRQEDLKAQLQNAKDNGGTDVDLVKSLQTELDQITSRQMQLLTEQSDINRRQRRAEKRKAGENDDEDLASGSSSPGAENSGDGDDFSLLRSQFYANQLANNLGKGTFMQDTLFDEGLRIAQQYGMADFAQELKQMHQVTGNDGDSNQTTGDGDSSEVSGTFPQNNGDNATPEHKENGGNTSDNSENKLPKVQPIKLATVNGTDFKVKTEPEETVNGR